MLNEIKLNKYILFISLIIFFDLNGFYLIDEATINVKDITLIFEVWFIIYVYFKNRQKVVYKYKWFILTSLIFVFTSSIMANVSYSQPIILGIRPQRSWIVTLLMYFPLTKLLKLNKVKTNDIIKCIDILNVLYILLGIIQDCVNSFSQN